VSLKIEIRNDLAGSGDDEEDEAGSIYLRVNFTATERDDSADQLSPVAVV
jgi:hypothetical protein